MIHLFKEGKSHQVFILFHGTGGDENSLLGLAQMLDKNAHVLALRGSVNEHGMNRFFKRHRVGLYDFVNLKEETKKVDTFIQKAIKSYHLEDKELIAVGFSNGANM